MAVGVIEAPESVEVALLVRLQEFLKGTLRCSYSCVLVSRLLAWSRLPRTSAASIVVARQSDPARLRYYRTVSTVLFASGPSGAWIPAGVRWNPARSRLVEGRDLRRQCPPTSVGGRFSIPHISRAPLLGSSSVRLSCLVILSPSTRPSCKRGRPVAAVTVSCLALCAARGQLQVYASLPASSCRATADCD